LITCIISTTRTHVGVSLFILEKVSNSITQYKKSVPMQH